MPTAIARVTVTRDGATWTATCSRCEWSVAGPSRLSIDVAGMSHQREHVNPDPRDQINAFGQVIG